MDVNEKTAAETIQDLEITVAKLNGRLAALRKVLLKENLDP